MSNKLILNEDELTKEFTQEAEQITPQDVYKGDMEEILDEVLEQNEEEIALGGRDFVNVCFTGGAGAGKTARIRDWAKDNDINLVVVRAVDLDETDMGGVVAIDREAKIAQRFKTGELNGLLKPRSVLFLDEYNRARNEVRGSLLTLIQDHVITDPESDGREIKLPNFLFTIAAQNPASSDYNTRDLDDAEYTRFVHKYVESDPKATLQYINKSLDSMITKASEVYKDDEEKLNKVLKKNNGRKALANTLLSSPDFFYDTEKEIETRKEKDGDRNILNARTLLTALKNSDGTKADFLKKWEYNLPMNKKKTAETILTDYVDVDDKANDALKGHQSQSKLLKKKSLTDTLNDLLNEE